MAAYKQKVADLTEHIVMLEAWVATLQSQLRAQTVETTE